MEALRLKGGQVLRGNVVISGAKNASLPIIAACLLSSSCHTLTNVPDLADVQTLMQLLRLMGAHCHWQAPGQLQIDTQNINDFVAPYNLVRTMRAAILVLGPLLARYGQAKVSLPGGCAIGARPIDQHLQGLSQLGAQITLEHGYVIAQAPQGLKGAAIALEMPTVTGTENLLLAACLARGKSQISNAAQEPEIVDLAQALTHMGAKISGAGTDTIVVQGCSELGPCHHRIVGDRIECGTWLVAGALAGDSLRLLGAEAGHQQALIEKLRLIGAEVEQDQEALVVRRGTQRLGAQVQTAPYPGFPTDMQAQLMTLLVLAKGMSTISETIFENRFMHVPELNRLGAKIRIDGNKALIQGVPRLSGSVVMATDLRASASLVLAGLMAEGETIVRRVYHLDRGYDHLERKLQQVGATIERFVE